MTRLSALAAALLLATAPASARSLRAKAIPGRTAPVVSLAPVGAALNSPTLATKLAAPSLSLSQGLVLPRLETPLAKIDAAARESFALAPSPGIGSRAGAVSAAAVRFDAPQRAGNAASPARKATGREQKEKTPVLESLKAAAKKTKTSEGPADIGALFDGAGPVHLAIVGPPGVGKTTQGKRLARETGIVHISAGQLLREYAKDKPDIQAQMNKGELVPTELVMRLVQERLARADVKERGFILDGFPRRPVEEAALREILKDGQELDAVIRLDAPKAELKKRILARGRNDDKPDVFEERMRIYRQETLPVIEKLDKELPTIRPDGRTKKIESIYASLVERIARWLGAR
jgi:adenylate kinase